MGAAQDTPQPDSPAPAQTNMVVKRDGRLIGVAIGSSSIIVRAVRRNWTMNDCDGAVTDRGRYWAACLCVAKPIGFDELRDVPEMQFTSQDDCNAWIEKTFGPSLTDSRGGAQ